MRLGCGRQTHRVLANDTTNYDLLLEQHAVVPGGQSVTWLAPQDIFSLLRGGRGVIHLHGRYDYPKSIILSTVDYERIVRRPEDSVRVAQALFHSGRGKINGGGPLLELRSGDGDIRVQRN